jgi:succinoglycan biosynthesis protein ExoA
MTKPFVSVIIPCRNEARFIGRCLDSILANDYPKDRMEILVADGESDDGTREIIRKYAGQDERVRLLVNPHRFTPMALNLAIGAARGDVIARVDAHATIAPDYLTQCVQHLETSGADNVGGVMQTVAQEEGCLADLITTVLSHRFGVGNSYFRIGSTEPRWVDTVFGGCWRRTVFERVGMFNVQLKRSQDMEFSLRLKAAGGRTLLIPTIRTKYYARARLGPFVRHNFLNGEWAILPFLFSPVIPVSLRHLIPMLFVTALLAGVLLAPLTLLPFAAVTFLYAAASTGASIHAAVQRRRWTLAIFLPFVFFLLHSSYGLGSVFGGIKAIALSLRRGSLRPKEQPCIPQR